MIEENKINKNKTIDALPIPEDAVILKTKNILDSSQLALLGIKEIIKQRGINLKVKKEVDALFFRAHQKEDALKSSLLNHVY